MPNLIPKFTGTYQSFSMQRRRLEPADLYAGYAAGDGNNPIVYGSRSAETGSRISAPQHPEVARGCVATRGGPGASRMTRLPLRAAIAARAIKVDTA